MIKIFLIAALCALIIYAVAYRPEPALFLTM
jgi:predicted membrane protein